MDLETAKRYANQGELEKVPTKAITRELLLSKGPNGIPTICYIVSNKQLKYVPKEHLTEEVLSQKDLLGASCYLLAAKKDQFSLIPEKLVTASILKEAQNKEKVWGILIRSKGIDHILPLINELIDDIELDDNSTFLHACATVGELHKIPPKLITKERILKEKTLGKDNVLHYAAHYGCLEQIPKSLLNYETMSTVNNYKETPLHSAADGGKLNLIPTEFLTQENLDREDNWGTVFHKAALNCTFDTFPKRFLTEKNLMAKSITSEVSPLVVLAHKCSEPETNHSKQHRAVSQFSKLIKNLSKESLNSLIKELTIGEWEKALEISQKEITRREVYKKVKEEEAELEI
jgi:hypothetical protein